MRIRTRMATAIGGTAFAGLTALGMSTAIAAPAGAQQVKPAAQASSVAPQQATIAQHCWDGDCGWGWDDGWDDDWYGGGWGW